VSWYDVDHPEVVALRRTLYPERDHYRMIGSSVTGPDLLDQAPGLRCVDALSALYTPGAAALSRAIRVFAALVRPFPALRDLDVYYRYTF
jgi:hypothetical protein